MSMNTLPALALIATKHNDGKPHPHPKGPGQGPDRPGQKGGGGHESVADMLNGLCPTVGPINTWGEWLAIGVVVGLVLLFLACRPGAVIRFGFRYLTGAPLFGERRTDAKFLVDGTGWNMTARREPYFAGRVPSKWALLAGWKRAAVRVGVPFGLFVIGVCWASDPFVTRWVLTLSGSVLLGLLAFRGFRWWATREHRETYVRPLATTLAGPAGWPPDMKAKHWLDVPQNFDDDDAVITVHLGPDFLAGETPDEFEAQTWAGSQKATTRDRFNGIVYEKLGLNSDEMVATYTTVGRNPSVKYKHRSRVPNLVTVEEARPALLAAKDSAPLLGFGRGNKPIAVDLTADSPHIAVSFDSGAGKSTMTGGMAAQFLAKGGRVTILDPKMTSHMWVKGPLGQHPHVRLLVEVEDIHEELLAIDADRQRRQRAAAAGIVDVGARVLVLTEEMNMLANVLTSWWKANKPSGAPATPPSVTALANIAFAGRQAMLHSLAVAQRFDARLVGGGDARINFAARCIRGDASAWRMLAPEFRRPRMPKRAGRFHISQGGSLEEVQGIFWHSPDKPESWGEIQAWAWSCFEDGLDHPCGEPMPRDEFYGAPAAEPVDLDKPAAPAPEGDGTAPAEGFPPPVVEGERKPADDVTLRDDESAAWDNIMRGWEGEDGPDSPSAGFPPPVVHEDPTPEPEPEPVGVGLRQASADQGDGLVPVTLAALRKASQRDTEFPPVVREQGREKFYDPDALRAWERNRPRATSPKAPTEGSK